MNLSNAVSHTANAYDECYKKGNVIGFSFNDKPFDFDVVSDRCYKIDAFLFTAILYSEFN